MRRSFRWNWLKNKSGEICGLNLGSDHCAEHEWGISELKQILGIQDENPSGLESRKITNLLEKNLFIHDDKASKKKTGKTILLIEAEYTISAAKQDLKNLNAQNMPYAPKGGEKPDLCPSWSSRGLCVVASKDEDRQNLRVLIQALKNSDAALWLGGGGVFENAGLCIGILSKIDDESKQHMKEADENSRLLKAADAATGIKELLAGANKRYFALSPAWASSIKSTARGEINTAFDVIYWLNPMEQDKNNYGWFTVEQLREWAQNQGPIVKEGKSA